MSDIANFVKVSLINLFLWPIASEWHCTFFERHCLITSFLIMDRMWVTLHWLSKAGPLHIFLLWTGCERRCTVCGRQSHQIFSYDNREWVTANFKSQSPHQSLSYDQQLVSDVAHFVKGSLITSCPMTNREWATLHILSMAVSTTHIWPTACEWHCTFSERSHDIFSMTNSLWVTLHICEHFHTSFHMTNSV